jgi:hypothetical protein
MGDLTCYIMNNMVGIDFIQTVRMYDLKGSKYGRNVKLSQEQIDGKTGLKVLKDLNFMDIKEKLDIEPL